MSSSDGTAAQPSASDEAWPSAMMGSSTYPQPSWDELVRTVQSLKVVERGHERFFDDLVVEVGLW